MHLMEKKDKSKFISILFFNRESAKDEKDSI
jgi:hypothetical protein